MKRARQLAWGLLILAVFASLAADWLAPASYAMQFRDAPGAEP